MKKYLSLFLSIIIVITTTIFTYADETTDSKHVTYQEYSALYDKFSNLFPEAELISKATEETFTTETSHLLLEQDLFDLSKSPVSSFSKSIDDNVYNLDLYEDGTFVVYGAERSILTLENSASQDTSGFSVSDGVYNIFYYGFYSYGLQQLSYNVTRMGNAGSYSFSTPYALNIYLIRTYSFSTYSNSIEYQGNLREVQYIQGYGLVERDYMGVVITASVNIATGTILVDHYYRECFPFPWWQ